MFVLYISVLSSIQNYAETVSIQEKLRVCIMSLCIQNDNYFKKVVQLYLFFASRPMRHIFILCE